MSRSMPTILASLLPRRRNPKVSLREGRTRAGLSRFFFPAECDTWLVVLRIGLGLQITLYALSGRADWHELFAASGAGFVNREVSEALVAAESPLSPRLGWIILLGARVGLPEGIVISATWLLLVLAGCCLMAGFFSRSAAVLAWFVHVSAVASAEFLSYGMDNFTTIGLFYLALSPLPDRAALDSLIWKPPAPNARILGFFRRILQLHVCMIYFFAGITKCMGVEWWNGTSVWRAMISPPYNLVDPHVLVSWKLVLPLMSISVCLLETAYPFFIWFNKTRCLWLLAVCGMHLAIGLTMGLYLFSLIMIILNLAAFGAPTLTDRRAGGGRNAAPRAA